MFQFPYQFVHYFRPVLFGSLTRTVRNQLEKRQKRNKWVRGENWNGTENAFNYKFNDRCLIAAGQRSIHKFYCDPVSALSRIRCTFWFVSFHRVHLRWKPLQWRRQVQRRFHLRLFYCTTNCRTCKQRQQITGMILLSAACADGSDPYAVLYKIAVIYKMTFTHSGCARNSFELSLYCITHIRYIRKNLLIASHFRLAEKKITTTFHVPYSRLVADELTLNHLIWKNNLITWTLSEHILIEFIILKIKIKISNVKLIIVPFTRCFFSYCLFLHLFGLSSVFTWGQNANA